MAQWTNVDMVTASDDGVDVANQINNLRDAFLSGSSGATAPGNALPGMIYTKTITGGFQPVMVTGVGAEVALGTITTATGVFALPIEVIEAALISSGRGVPTGTIIMHGSVTPPPGYLKLNGAAYSRTTYSELFAEIGTTYGDGDGSTTFNVDDWRGIFPRGWDDGRGVDSGRVFGSEQMDQMQRLTGSFGLRAIEGGINPVVGEGGAFSESGVDNASRVTFGSGATQTQLRREVAFDSANSPDARVSSTTSGETRPRNVATLFCIKY